MPLPLPFVLGSASPRRKYLLNGLGLKFEIDISGIDEQPIEGETPEQYCLRLAEEKAVDVAVRHPAELVLGADTSVIVDGAILGKPVDKDDAFRMLRMISNRWHTVITAFALICKDREISITRAVSSQVFIRQLSDAQIRWYIETGEPMDKAGSYAIQGVGASLVKEVQGSYTCVVGLPLAELVEELETLFGPDCLLGS
jgi:nucleoside triphosphate pyrophosphatase